MLLYYLDEDDILQFGGGFGSVDYATLYKGSDVARESLKVSEDISIHTPRKGSDEKPARNMP